MWWWIVPFITAALISLALPLTLSWSAINFYIMLCIPLFFAEAESWRRDREESMKCWEKEEEELLKLQDLVEWDENSMSAWGFFLLTQFEKFPFWRFYFGLCLWLKCFWGCNNFDFCWVFLKWNWICKNLSFNNLQNYN